MNMLASSVILSLLISVGISAHLAYSGEHDGGEGKDLIVVGRSPEAVTEQEILKPDSELPKEKNKSEPSVDEIDWDPIFEYG